jgi:uncharacterized protein (TIRG00374 family)
MKIRIPGQENTIDIDIKKLFFPVIVLVAVVILFLNFSELREIGRLFSVLKWYWVVLTFVALGLAFLAQAVVYNLILKIFKFKWPGGFGDLLQNVVTIIFLNFTIPSLGFAGNVWFIKRLKKNGMQEGKALMSVLSETACYYIAFFIALTFSVLYLFFSGQGLDVRQMVGFGGFILVLAALFFGGRFFLRDREKARKRICWLADKIDRAEDGKPQKERATEIVDGIYSNFYLVKENIKKFFWPITVQFSKYLIDGLMISLIFLAFGGQVSFFEAVMAFVFGRLFGIVSFIPGGVGAFEGAMVLILNSFGQPLELCLSVVLIYRFFSYWLYFPTGLWFLKRVSK